MDIAVNYLSVLAGGVAAMIVGALWYGPIFGKLWVSLQGFTAEQMDAAKSKGMGKSYALAFAGALLTSYVLAHFPKGWAEPGITGAWNLAFWPWIGFVVPLSLSSVLWEGKPWKLFVLNIAQSLVSLFAVALVLVYWP